MITAKIPEYEYKQRIAKAAEIAADRGLDVLLFSSTESDFASVRYFTGYYTLWERTGVAISSKGKVAMIIGPEAMACASYYSNVKNIYSLREYRESADPDYPELTLSSFHDVFASIGLKSENLRIGLGSFLDTNIEIYLGLKKEYPHAEIVRVDDIMSQLRRHKSENEIACLRAAYSIAEKTTARVLEEIRPGMTESNVVGIIQKYIYQYGAEYEGMVQYVLSDAASRHALSRSYPDRVIKKDSFVQFDIAARVDGYSSAIGIPISMGKFTDEQRRFVEFGRKMHDWARNNVKAGVVASEIAKKNLQLYIDNGFGDNYLYGPLHGLGMIEVEAPWVETTTDYKLEENFTYQIDTFLIAKTFGLRWEEGIVITTDGCELLNSSPVTNQLYELNF